MASNQMGAAFRGLCRLFGGEGTLVGLDEGGLLQRFISRSDPAALEALVSRHGPMVLGVCRRVLGDSHDSEDAFQATFLILVKKARAIRDPNLLGPWLHGVAHRVAVRARANRAIRRSREIPGAEDAAMTVPLGFVEDDFVDRAELRVMLDDEIARLPEKYRQVVVFCYLDGLTHDQAAERLRCPVGTVRSRLSTAREKLRARLSRQGIAVGTSASAGAFVVSLSAETAKAAVPYALAKSTLSAGMALMTTGAGAVAAGTVSATAASLANGVTTTMMITKVKVLGSIALASALSVGIGGAAVVQFGGAGGAGGAAKPAGDSLEELLAKMKAEANARAKESETRALQFQGKAEELQAELAKLRTENQRLTSQLKFLSDVRDTEEANQQQSKELAKLRELLDDSKSRLLLSKKRVPNPNDPTIQAIQKEVDELTKSVDEAQVAVSNKRRALPISGSRPTTIGEAADSGAASKTDAPSAGSQGGMGGFGGGFGGGMGGEMGGGMGGGMGMTGPAKKGLISLQMPDCIIVVKPESKKVAAYSIEKGEWSTFDIPAGVKATPTAAANCVALELQGDEVAKLAVYVPSEGKWYPIDLKAPFKRRVTTVASAGLAAYILANKVYAFSSTTKQWDVLELPEGARFGLNFPANQIIIENGDHVYIFSAKTGKWTDFDASDFKHAGGLGP